MQLKSSQICFTKKSSEMHVWGQSVIFSLSLSLSLSLSSTYTNDLLRETNNPVYSFVDDSTLVSHFRSEIPLPATETYHRRQEHITAINQDLEKVQTWGYRTLVQFNTKVYRIIFLIL
ncbi:MAG: hypothetical protein KTM48_04215 [Wolbachia endosymbiont of Pissodes strobi]|nr:hypothetical protein [Wolbachia endosymbiont of Pissodes strobi]